MFDDYGLSSFVGTENDGVIRTAADLRGQGLRNGDLPASVYSLYGNHGTMYNGSAKQENTQTTFKASGSADIKDHEFSFGFEFEQRDDSYWGMGPMGMWGLMRQLTNKHILQRDLANPKPVFDANGVYQDTVNYDRLFVAEEQSTFDRNLRDALNNNDNFLNGFFGSENNNTISQTDFIDIDALSPEYFDIKMFSPDELLNSGSSLVYYYGYDIHGNKLTSDPTLKDFFEKQDSDGNYLREIASFKPIYTAVYVQDKFAIDDLIFNIGLRVDRYDANQKVLSDKYLLHQAYTVGESTDFLNNADIPSTIGNGYVVYVDDASNPSAIVGYRDNETWYNADGLQISDPLLVAEAAGGQIQPYLVDPEGASAGEVKVDQVFEDYEPETIFMPRIAFSFPISDEAQFFAHYDVLTQRPPQSNRLEPVDYLFMADRVGALLNNPDLKS